jgi:hypothetical protein
MMQEINIKNRKMRAFYKNIEKSNTNLILLKNGDRKEGFIRKLVFYLHKNKKADDCIIISEKDFFCHDFPYSENNIFYKYDENIIKNLKYNQKRLCIILNNYYKLEDKYIFDLMINSQKYNILFFVILAYPIKFISSHNIAKIFDYILLFDDDCVVNQKIIYEYYAYMFPTFEVFHKLFFYLKYVEFIMINNKHTSHNICDIVSLYNILK